MPNPAPTTVVHPALAQRRAAQVVAELTTNEPPEVLAEVAVRLDRIRSFHPLERVMQRWALSHADVADMFGLSRQAIGKWLNIGVPAGRLTAVADMAAATDLLERYLQPDRIAAVVRRPAPALGNRSLLDLATAGDTAGVLAACRAMFEFGRATA
ncbi:MAG: hypothetical protein JWM34_1136 [Ilumatobacteraceae bacterium]|nr:hypothetical protein [Ilumatobacteraceae bacterium]